MKQFYLNNEFKIKVDIQKPCHKLFFKQKI